MATLVLTVVGTVLGGPLGGAIGAAVGSQVDAAIMGGRSAEGPRLKDLTLQTSSYGAPLPLHFGQMRAAGTVIWATEMRERRETQGGGKGSPSVTSYSYTASFAVALASRPIVRVGRVWADGNLLRGTTGRLKVSGKMRVHTGHGDQQPDPLIAQAEGASRVPAFRHTAYVVFEDLALGDFGNRIPSLTFEIFADEGGTTVSRIVDSVLPEARYKGAARPLGGFTVDRGTAAATIQTLGEAFPLGCAGWATGWRFATAKPYWTSRWHCRNPYCRQTMRKPDAGLAPVSAVRPSRVRALAGCAITISVAIISRACNADVTVRNPANHWLSNCPQPSMPRLPARLRKRQGVVCLGPWKRHSTALPGSMRVMRRDGS